MSETSPPSDLLPMEFPPQSSRLASLAKTSAMLAVALGSKENAAAFGRKLSVSLTTFDPITCCWKTSQLSWDGVSTEFSETWPRSGLMRGGTVFPLPPLATPMNATAGGLLPTPRACDGTKGSGARKNGGGSYGLGHWVARRLGLKQQTTTKFDPGLSELLMGFPITWTALTPSETP